MPKVTARRPKRTKAEVEKEFSKIVDEAEAQKELSNPKLDEAARLDEEERGHR